MNRGSYAKRIASNHGISGFNEAPIHESGKWGRTGIHLPTWTRFNEAPIHESGKCGLQRGGLITWQTLQ